MLLIVKLSVILASLLTNSVATNEITTKDSVITKLLLFSRKTRAIEPNPSDAKPATQWNQILAQVLVDQLKILSFSPAKKEPNDAGITVENTTAKGSELANCFGQVLNLYKTLIYDKLFAYRVDQSRDDPIQNDAPKSSEDPKDDVELVDPSYHGRIVCDDCKTIEDEEGMQDAPVVREKRQEDCPEGQVKDANGKCGQLSRFILSIPKQCPDGYKRDWLGYCRVAWWF